MSKSFISSYLSMINYIFKCRFVCNLKNVYFRIINYKLIAQQKFSGYLISHNVY